MLMPCSVRPVDTVGILHLLRRGRSNHVRSARLTSRDGKSRCDSAVSRCVIFTRVSWSDQGDDPNKQAGRLVEWATQQAYSPNEMVKEVGAGLNGDRRELRRIMGNHIVVTASPIMAIEIRWTID